MAVFDSKWRWERQLAVARIGPGEQATFALASKPLSPGSPHSCNADTYDEERRRCETTWRGIVQNGMQLDTPEPIVNNAWRHLIVQNFELINGRRIHYSSGNQYDKLYEAEGTLEEIRRAVPKL